jgi:hypothetical protein
VIVEEIKAGQVWRRTRDGMLGRVESVEPGRRGYVRWRPLEGGRLRWNWKSEFTVWALQEDA